MARNIVQICNEAISDLPAHPIADIDDPNEKEARECARHLPGIVSELITLHDFDFVRRRIALAEVTNDRSGEWAKAYSLPNSIVSPIALIPNYQATSNNLTIETGSTSVTSGAIVLTPVLHWRGSWPVQDVIDYAVADGKLYTNIDAPILEYSFDALEPGKWSPLFAQAVIRHLAARIYRPILGEKADSREWALKQQAATRATNEAIADDLNRNPRQRREFVSEAEMAREADFGWGWKWRR